MSTPEPAPGAELPALVVAGPAGRVAEVARAGAILRAALIGILVLSVVVPLLIAWTVSLGSSGKPPGDDPAFLVPIVVSSLVLVALALVLLVASHATSKFVARRTGRADVFLDRIVVYKGERTIEVPWSKVKRLDVSSPDYVQVVRAFELRGSTDLAVPTPDPTAQARLLEVGRRPRDPAAPAAAGSPPLRGREGLGSLLLVASGGAGWRSTKRRLELALGLLYVVVMTFVGLVRMGEIVSPAVTFLRTWLASWQIEVLITLAPIIAYRQARAWLGDYSTARAGRAELFEKGILFFRGDQVTVLRWGEIEAFDDGSADVLVVHGRRPEGARETIPTPDEALRVRVLALLDERGVPRADPDRLVS